MVEPPGNVWNGEGRVAYLARAAAVEQTRITRAREMAARASYLEQEARARLAEIEAELLRIDERAPVA
ncbi:MAG TPA: hypothetical protein VMM78_02770 [Thermomicrobiales bacterium]|nr:hypothetical protein [Thermomicrobiales bacterium]